MSKKSRILCLILLISLFSEGITLCYADTTTELNKARDNVYALIEKGKLNEAKLAKDRLLADFNSEPNLPEVQLLIAFRYERTSNFEEAKNNFQQLIQSHPESPFANKARLGISRAEAMSFVMGERFDQAKAAVDKIAMDFAGNPDLPEAIYWIAERYERTSRFNEAKSNYQKVIQNHVGSTWAARAKLAASRAEAMALITAEKFDQAQKAIDKMAEDFASEAGLPGAIYWTTERFERLNRFEEAKQNYQRIIQNYHGSPYADRAKLGVSRAEAMSLIVSGNYDGAKAAIDKMTIDFAGNPNLPGALYWITEKYEWADKLDEAKGVYQKIIQNHPDSIYADRARLGIRRVDVMGLMDLPDGNLAQVALNEMIADFNDNAEMPRAVFIIGARYFLKARAPDCHQKAIKLVEKVINELPRTEAMAGMYEEVYCCAADCFFEMGEYTKAMSCYQKLVSEYPEYTLAYRAQFRVGKIYEKLGESGQISPSEAKAKARLAYEQLLRKYPTCKEADSARIWLYNHDPAFGGK